MSTIPPSSGTPKFPTPSVTAPGPKSTRGSETQARSSHQEYADRAETDAKRRIIEVQREVDQAQQNASKQLDRIHDDYIREASAEEARAGANLESQRSENYRELRDLQRAHQKELKRVRREGDQELDKVGKYYRETTYQTQRQGEQKIDELRAIHARQSEHERKQAEFEAEMVQSQYQARVKDLQEQKEKGFQEMAAATEGNYTKLRERSVQAYEDAQERFENQYKNTVKNQQEVIAKAEDTVAKRLHALREDSARKLTAYSERNQDPFYRMVDVQADVWETGDAYILTARIPDHEQKNISVSVRGDQITISGSRNNSEKLELGPGRSATTSSYQTFSESFPIHWPVEAKSLRREYDGEKLTVTIPKKKAYEERWPFQAKAPERAKMERPKFPDNLPGEKILTQKKTETPEDAT